MIHIFVIILDNSNVRLGPWLNIEKQSLLKFALSYIPILSMQCILDVKLYKSVCHKGYP